MQTAELDQERDRLQALARYEVLDSLPEESFQRLVRLVARTFAVPIALISFFDGSRQWIKAGIGLDASALERCDSLCRVVVEEGQAVHTPDAAQDARFVGNPHVIGGLGIRFYASVPLRTGDGLVIGTLCVADAAARPALDPAALAALKDFAAVVMDELDLRLATLQAACEADGQARYSGELKEALGLSQALQGISDLVELDLAPAELLLRAVALTGVALGVDWAGLAAIQGDRAVSVSAWHSPAGNAFAREAGRGVKRSEGGLLWQAEAQGEAAPPLFVEEYPSQHGAVQALVKAGAQAVVSAALGGHGGVGFVMTLVRLEVGRPWSRHERQLVSALVGAMRQAVARGAALELLRSTQDQLKLLLSSAPLVLWATDLSGVFTLSEGRALSDLGLVPGAALGQTVEALYAQAPQVIRNVRRALGGETFTDVVSTAGRSYDSSYAPIHDAQGRQVGAMGVGYDVTARLHAERGEQRARRRAEALVALSRALDGDHGVSNPAQEALLHIGEALDDTVLVLWKREGERFVPLGAPHGWPMTDLPWQECEVGVARSGLNAVLAGQGVYSGHASQDSSISVALLPVRVELPEQILLGAYRSGEVAGWSAEDRDLLESAARSLSAWSARRLQRDHLEQVAHVDALTALGNRRALDNDLTAALNLAARDGRSVGVLSIDIDGLKAINDHQGHGRGDELLRVFGEALRAGFRPGDRAYRLGGDEYLLVLPDVGPDALTRLLDRVEQAVNTTRQAGAFPSSATTSRRSSSSIR